MMAHSSAPASPFEVGSYLSDIVTGAHGDKYQKDLALVMFERATRKGYDFKLGYEMAIADKFDDVAFYNKTKNECILIQTKHADTSKGKPAPLKFDMLFPRDEATREKGDFSLFKYFKSYVTVQVNIRERKNIIIFTNRDFSRESLEQSAEVADRQVDEILRFVDASHVGLKVEKQLMKELLDYVNRDFNSLRDSIVKLFKEGTMDQTIKNFKTPLASILIRTNTSVSFSESSSSEAGQLLDSLSSLIDIRTAKLPLNKCTDIFTGKSRNKTLPILATEDLVYTFFEDLVLSIRQPDDLGEIVDQDLRSWMRTWVRPDYLIRLEEPQLKMSSVTLERFFNTRQPQEATPRAYKPFFQLSDGEKFYCNIKKDLEKQIQNLANYSSDTACDYYISRQIKYLEQNNNQTKRYKNSNKDEMYGSSMDNFKKAGLAIFTQITHGKNFVFDGDRSVEMKIRDDDFAKELFGKFDNNKVLLLTAEPGMGKSTILQFIALTAQQTSDVCVYLFYLNTFHRKFEETKESCSLDQFLIILETAMSETNSKNLRKTFECGDNQRKHLMIFDALDEVAPHNRKKALNMFKQMLKIPNMKILISARSNVKTLVENEFTVKSFSLVPFDNSDQTNFLQKFWCVSEGNKNSFLKYVNHLITNFHSGFNRALCEFTGLPLMLKMLAEVFTDHFNEYSNSNPNDFENVMPKENFTIINLYENFVRKCFANKMMKKIGIFYSDIDEEHESLFETFTLEHQLLAIKQIQIKLLQNDKKYLKVLEKFELRITNGTEKSPLVETVDKDVRFIHRSYAEFLVAQFLFNAIENYNADIFGADSQAKFLHDNFMIRIFLFTMIEKQFMDQHLNILETHYKKNHDIALAACQIHGERTVNFLLGTKFDSTIINRLLFVAAGNNCFKICTSLFENYQVTVDCIFIDSAPLHVAAERGHVDIVKLLLDRCANVNVKDMNGHTALHYAAGNGHVEVVSTLVAKSAEINAKQKDDCTPLYLAAQNGHSEVAKMLIDQSADVNAVEKHDLTPLHVAALNGHSEVAKMLLNKSADVNAKEKDDLTPLHLAALNGHSEVTKLLIDKSADVNAKQNLGWTPLHLAAQNGHPEVIEMLIDKSADIDAKQKDSLTPLHYAVLNGHSEIAKVLIDRLADVNAVEKDDLTPLHIAALNGNSEVAKMLIDKSADVNAKNNFDWTPLHLAAQNGHLDVVKMLLDKSADVNAKQKDDYTPLHVAAQTSYTDVVKMLINMSADVNAKEKDGLTPLHLAALEDHLEIVKLLIDNSADVNAKDKDDYTPLCIAAQNDQLDVAKMLIDQLADINAKQIDYCTPLHISIKMNHLEVAKLLIDKSADVNVTEKDDRTPLHLAAQIGHSEITKMLIDRSANINAREKKFWTPLHVAALHGHSEVVKMLIEKKSADVNAKQINGYTPLHFAAQNGQSEVVKMLIGELSDVNAKVNEGYTPLHFAAINGHSEAAKIFIDKLADVNAKAANAMTPLHVAAENGHLEVSKMLIDELADINAKDVDGWTPLHIAARNGHVAVVKLLTDCEQIYYINNMVHSLIFRETLMRAPMRRKKRLTRVKSKVTNLFS